MQSSHLEHVERESIDEMFDRLRAMAPPSSDPWDYVALQNRAMLARFHDQQDVARDPHPPLALARKLIARDFGGFEPFKAQFFRLATQARCSWIVWGLSFADFRFHLLPSESDLQGVAFCCSPMLVSDVASISDVKAATELYSRIDWQAVEHRIACLSEPLNLFDKPQDCQADASSEP